MTLALAPWLSALIAASLKGSIILIAGLLAVRGMRRSSAEARHAILAIALVAFLIVPIATALAPAWSVIAVPALPAGITVALDGATSLVDPGGSQAAQGTGAEMRTDSREGGAVTEATPTTPTQGTSSANASRASATGQAGAERGSAGPAASVSSGDPIDLPPLRTMLLMAWVAGASVIALRLLLGVVRLRVLSRRATMVTDGGWLQTAHAIARRLGLTRGVTLLRGDREAVPMTWGVLSPVVWLPPAADGWPAELRSSVLSHELAHVRRRDAVTQWLANVTLALHWFNPLVWMATRALRAERERACDDAVLALGAAPDDYAAHLLDMVRALGAKSGPAPAMAMARRSQFEGRLLAILDRACSRAPVGAGRLIVAGAGAMTLVLLLGGLRSSEAARVSDQTRERARHADTPITTLEVKPRAPATPPLPEPTLSHTDGVGNPSRDVKSSAQEASARGADALASLVPVLRGDAGRKTTLAGVTPPPVNANSVALNEVVGPTLPPDSPGGVTAVAPQAPPSALPIAPRYQGLTLSRSDTALLLDVISAAEGISSSVDRTTVLDRVANIPNLAPGVVTALGRAAGRVPSSSERAKLLRTLVVKQPHATGESRRAVLDALTSEMTSTDFASVLELFVKRDSVDDAALADAFTAAGRINANTEKARVLVTAARHRKPDGAARAAFVKAAATISSGSDRARVLSALLDEPPQDGKTPTP